jgi:hypothetical protein
MMATYPANLIHLGSITVRYQTKSINCVTEQADVAVTL